MICDHIQKVKRTDTFHDGSHFEVTFTDGSVANEKDTNWSSFSREKTVSIPGGASKLVRVSVHPIKSIKVVHEGLSTQIDVPEGNDVYQAFRSRTSLLEAGKAQVIGRTVGILNGDEIVEERFIDAIAKHVIGARFPHTVKKTH